MADDLLHVDERMRTAAYLVASYLLDKRPHAVARVAAVVADYGGTAAGQHLFAPAAPRVAIEIARDAAGAALKAMLNAGEVVHAGVEQVRMTKIPRFAKGKFRLLQGTEVAVKTLIQEILGHGGVSLTAELHAAAEKASEGWLDELIGPGVLPREFHFALVQRVLDGLIEQEVCELIRQDGVEILCLKTAPSNPEPGKEPRKTKQEPDKAAAGAAVEKLLALDETFTPEEKAAYYKQFGVPRPKCTCTPGAAEIPASRTPKSPSQ